MNPHLATNVVDMASVPYLSHLKCDSFLFVNKFKLLK